MARTTIGMRLHSGNSRKNGLTAVVAVEIAAPPEAIELARRRRPDVELLDVSMPAGGGARAATGIREVLSDARLVALSAHAGPDVQLDTSHAGAIG